MSEATIEPALAMPDLAAIADERAPHYRQSCAALPERSREGVARAAALVETALELQAVARHVTPPAADLLLGDLCLSRASRLLVDVADERMQVAFAKVVQSTSAAAAAQAEVPDVRDQLSAAIAGSR